MSQETLSSRAVLSPRILVIDAEQDAQELIGQWLRAEGMEVDFAAEGLAGLTKAVEIEPDLILLDVSLPEMDGYEVCELLVVQEQTCRTPILFVGPPGQAASRLRGFDCGALDYIAKPLDGAELLARVRVGLRCRYLLQSAARRALVDGLTGLWNRRYFDQRLEAELASAARHARPLSCVMLDIDQFKQLNDTHGHTLGDEGIRAVAKTLRQGCRKEDVPCRYGGDEFVILCPDVPAAGAMVMVERLREKMRAAKLSRPDVQLTCSFGVADLTAAGGSLIQAADQALYAAKRAGRNRIERAS